MAIISSNSESLDIEDGSLIQEKAEELGVPFGCTKGNCGTCITIIKEGMENLSSETNKEQEYGLNEGERLICQCTILKDEVILDI